MRLFFVRHGESEANLLNEFSNRGCRHGLTERGREQAAALARRLEARSVARVFCSPLLRAVETAGIVASVWDVEYEIADALREYDCGVLEGRSDAASWQEHQRVLDEWLIDGRWGSRIEGGESFTEIRQRFVPYIEELVAAYGESLEGIVLIGHGGLYRCMLPLVLEGVDHSLAMERVLSNTGYVEAELIGDRLVCVEWVV